MVTSRELIYNFTLWDSMNVLLILKLFFPLKYFMTT